MRPSTVFSVGCFLLTLGLGWYVFTTFVISAAIVGWILIVAGTVVIASSLISWKHPRLPIRGVASGLVGGLVLSLFVTSGFGVLPGWVSPYRAEDTEFYSGPVTANTVNLTVDAFNGPIQVSTWSKAEYRVRVKMVAKGVSPQNAEDALKDLKINFVSQSIQDQQTLTLNFNGPLFAHSRYSIDVAVVLPANALIALDLDSSNGDLSLTEITGTRIHGETSNGRLIFDQVSADEIRGVTSNGGIDGTVDAPDTVLSTSNGGISLTLPCSVSGQYDLSTSNGNVKLKVSSAPEVGYDLDLSTSNGAIDIALAGLEYSQNQPTRKNAQSEDFSTKAVQITIEATTTNGNIDIETP